MARNDYLQRDWWFASEGQTYLEIGYQAFLTFVNAERIRSRHLPGAAYPQYCRADIEQALAKHITVGVPQTRGRSRRKKQVVEPTTTV